VVSQGATARLGWASRRLGVRDVEREIKEIAEAPTGRGY
jgi:hypothetical protein